MSVVTTSLRVLTYCEELPPLNLHESSMRWSCEVILYLHLQKIHKQQARKKGDLSWEAPTIKITWPFDHVTNARSQDNLKNLYLDFPKAHDH